MVLCIIWVTYETDVQGHPEAFNLEDLVIQHCSVVALHFSHLDFSSLLFVLMWPVWGDWWSSLVPYYWNFCPVYFIFYIFYILYFKKGMRKI